MAEENKQIAVDGKGNEFIPQSLLQDIIDDLWITTAPILRNIETRVWSTKKMQHSPYNLFPPPSVKVHTGMDIDNNAIYTPEAQKFSIEEKDNSYVAWAFSALASTLFYTEKEEQKLIVKNSITQVILHQEDKIVSALEEVSAEIPVTSNMLPWSLLETFDIGGKTVNRKYLWLKRTTAESFLSEQEYDKVPVFLINSKRKMGYEVVEQASKIAIREGWKDASVLLSPTDITNVLRDKQNNETAQHITTTHLRKEVGTKAIAYDFTEEIIQVYTVFIDFIAQDAQTSIDLLTAKQETLTLEESILYKWEEALALWDNVLHKTDLIKQAVLNGNTDLIIGYFNTIKNDIPTIKSRLEAVFGEDGGGDTDVQEAIANVFSVNTTIETVQQNIDTIQATQGSFGWTEGVVLRVIDYTVEEDVLSLKVELLSKNEVTPNGVFFNHAVPLKSSVKASLSALQPNEGTHLHLYPLHDVVYSGLPVEDVSKRIMKFSKKGLVFSDEENKTATMEAKLEDLKGSFLVAPFVYDDFVYTTEFNEDSDNFAYSIPLRMMPECALQEVFICANQSIMGIFVKDWMGSNLNAQLIETAVANHRSWEGVKIPFYICKDGVQNSLQNMLSINLLSKYLVQSRYVRKMLFYVGDYQSLNEG